MFTCTFVLSKCECSEIQKVIQRSCRCVTAALLLCTKLSISFYRFVNRHDANRLSIHNHCTIRLHQARATAECCLNGCLLRICEYTCALEYIGYNRIVFPYRYFNLFYLPCLACGES